MTDKPIRVRQKYLREIFVPLYHVSWPGCLAPMICTEKNLNKTIRRVTNILIIRQNDATRDRL